MVRDTTNRASRKEWDWEGIRVRRLGEDEAELSPSARRVSETRVDSNQKRGREGEEEQKSGDARGEKKASP